MVFSEKILLKTDSKDMGRWLAESFRGPPLYKTITLASLRELGKIPFSTERFISFVNGEITEGRMNWTTLAGMQSGPDNDEQFKLFTILATPTSKAGYNTIDLRQGGPR